MMAQLYGAAFTSHTLINPFELHKVKKHFLFNVSILYNQASVLERYNNTVRALFERYESDLSCQMSVVSDEVKQSLR